MKVIHAAVGFLRRLMSGKAKPLEGSIFDVTVNSIQGKPVNLSAFKGRKLLIVNTASGCGYTPQLRQLEKLSAQYKEKIAVLGFPSNDFFQENSSESEIQTFCMTQYGVSFPMFQKIHVTGGEMHPLYRILLAKSGKVPQWNFSKFLIDENGNVLGYYPPGVKPLDPIITSQL